MKGLAGAIALASVVAAATFGLVTTAANAASESENLYWNRFTIACGGCQPTASIRVWEVGDFRGPPRPIGAVRGNPGCVGEAYATRSWSSNSGGDYFANVRLKFSGGCTDVKWRLGFSHG